MKEQNKNIISNSAINADGNIHIGDVVNINMQQPPMEQPITSVTIQQIRELITRGKVKQALEELLQYAKSFDGDLYNQVILQAQRWNSLKKNEQLGLKSAKDVETVSNRIVYGLLAIIQELE